MIHLTPQQLSSYMDGELNEASTELVRRHMGACEECTLKFASLEVQEDLLSRALVHDPGDEFFAEFTAAVERQIPTGKDSGAKPASLAAARPSPPRATPTPAAKPAAQAAPPAAGPPPTPRTAEVVSAPTSDMPEMEEVGAHIRKESENAAFVRAAAPPRAVEAPMPRPKAPPRPKPYRPKVRRPAPSIPWYAAVILAVISASVGVVVSRTEPLSAWLDSVMHGSVAQPTDVAPVPDAPITAPPAETAPVPRANVPDSKVGSSDSRGNAPAAKASAAVSKENAALSKESGQPRREAVIEPPIDDEAMDPEIQTDDASLANTPDLPEPEPQEASRFLKSDAPPPRAKDLGNQGDPFGSIPAAAAAQVRVAQKSVAAADNDPSPARYETAAADWERATALLQGWQQSQGRFEIASAKYRAWEMVPTPGRAAAATAAIRSYMASATQGPARDQARAWMARLSR